MTQQGVIAIQLVWGFVIAGALGAAVILLLTFGGTMSAEQDVAYAALAGAVIAIPYAVARAVTEITRANKYRR